jgi:hypothetical protein
MLAIINSAAERYLRFPVCTSARQHRYIKLQHFLTHPELVVERYGVTVACMAQSRCL